jgi:RNA polymerase sigma-70 factor, ECF subfamily
MRSWPSARLSSEALNRMEPLQVAEALSRLASDHRTVVVRAYYLGQSVAELAEALNVPRETVRSRLHYGLHALRLALQEETTTD